MQTLLRASEGIAKQTEQGRERDEILSPPPLKSQSVQTGLQQAAEVLPGVYLTAREEGVKPTAH